LSIAIERIKALKKNKQASHLEDIIKNLLRSYENEASNFLTEIQLPLKGRNITVYIEDVLYFKSDGNYIQVVTKTKTYLHRSTLNSFNDSFDTNHFLRIHRSFILNKFYIKKSVYNSNNEYKFYLKKEEQLVSSRSYKSLISEYLSSLSKDGLTSICYTWSYTN